VKIPQTITIEDLITAHPRAVRFLVQNNIPCLVCGEPVWGTFEEVARQSGKSPEEIEELIAGLSAALQVEAE
jgi:hypothetical protein